MDVHVLRVVTNGAAELKDPRLLDRATEVDCPLYT